jgi:flagellin-like protein
MHPQSLRREERAISPIIAVIFLVVVVILAGVSYVLITGYLGEKEVCEGEGFQEWFKILNYLDPNKVSLELLKANPGIPTDQQPINSRWLPLVGFSKDLRIDLYLWSGFLILKTVFFVGCTLSGYNATIYQDSSQGAVVDIIIGLILGVESEEHEKFYLVPTEYRLTLEDSDYTLTRKYLDMGSMVDGLEDYPAELEGLSLDRTIPIEDRR